MAKDRASKRETDLHKTMIYKKRNQTCNGAAKNALKPTNCIRNTLVFFSQQWTPNASGNSWTNRCFQWAWASMWWFCVRWCDGKFTGYTMNWHFTAVISIVRSDLFYILWSSSSASRWISVCKEMRNVNIAQEINLKCKISNQIKLCVFLEQIAKERSERAEGGEKRSDFKV